MPADPSPKNTVFAYLHPDEVAHSWHLAWNTAYLMSPYTHGRYIEMRVGTDGLPAARNKVVAQFLDMVTEDPAIEWLWWTDTDQGWHGNALDMLHEAAHRLDRPIMGALAFINREIALDGMGGYVTEAGPAIYRWVQRVDGQQGFTPFNAYPRDTVVKVDGIGSACILIHRHVFTDIAEKYGPEWYSRLKNPTVPNQILGEDLSFCARATMCGIPIYCHTGVKTNHLKPVWLSEDHYNHPGEEVADVSVTQ